MKKILIISIFFFFSALSAQADEIKRILVGNKSAKISIIAFESLTCSHCANFSSDLQGYRYNAQVERCSGDRRTTDERPCVNEEIVWI